MTFSEKLSSLRKQANLTQSDLAEKLNVSRQAITKWENGIGLPDLDNIKKLSSIFNTSIDELLDYKVEEIKLNLDTIEEKMDKENAKLKNIDNFILQKFKNSDAIYSLTAIEKLKFGRAILAGIYSFFDIDVALFLDDFIKNGFTYYYLVEEKDRQFLVIVNRNKIMTKKLTEKFDKKMVIDGYIYSKIKNGKLK